MNPVQRATNPFIHYGILALIYGIGMLTLFSHTVFHSMHMHHEPVGFSASAAAIGDCTGTPAHEYRLTFTNQGIMPSSISAQRCDAVTVVNNTGDEIIAALGPHEHHLHYPWFKETPLTQGQTYNFRLVEVGMFPIHDHDNDDLHATLVVKP